MTLYENIETHELFEDKNIYRKQDGKKSEEKQIFWKDERKVAQERSFARNNIYSEAKEAILGYATW
jgi:hypothetical protein